MFDESIFILNFHGIVRHLDAKRANLWTIASIMPMKKSLVVQFSLRLFGISSSGICSPGICSFGRFFLFQSSDGHLIVMIQVQKECPAQKAQIEV